MPVGRAVQGYRQERGRQTHASIIHTLVILGSLIIALGLLPTSFILSFVGPPSGRFAFVFGAERAPGVVEALNATGAFKAVFRVDDARVAERLCDSLERFSHTPYGERIRVGCRSKAVVVVTEEKLAAAVVFLGSGDELTARATEVLTFERFDNGNIDIYDGEKHVGYTKGYELRRIFLTLYWNPVGVGYDIEGVVRRYEKEMYEAAGFVARGSLDAMSKLAVQVGVLILAISFSMFLFKSILHRGAPQTPS